MNTHHLLISGLGMLLAAMPCWGQPGALDPSFGTGGAVAGAAGSGQAVAVLSDGRIIALAHPRVHALLPDGTTDASFGSAGSVNITASFGAVVSSVLLVQPDDRILLLGSTSNGLFAARLMPNGAKDLTFGTQGLATIAPVGGQAERCNDAVLQADGRIVLCGSTASGSNMDILVMRLNTNGSLDDTYGQSGRTVVDPFGSMESGVDAASSIALRDDGSAVITGKYGSDALPQLLFVAGFDTNGDADPTFGTNGFTLEPGTGSACTEGTHIAVRTDGRVVVTGERTLTEEGPFMRRYLGDGGLDASFGQGGERKHQLPSPEYDGSHFRALHVLPEGNALVLVDHTHAALALFGISGTLQPWFGEAGLAHAGQGSTSEGNDLVVQEDGRIVVVGTSYDAEGNSSVMFFRLEAAVATAVDDIGSTGPRLQVFGTAIAPESRLVVGLTNASLLHVEVMDAVGRSVLPLLERARLSGGEHVIPLDRLANLGPGLYQVRVTTEAAMRSVPVLVP